MTSPGRLLRRHALGSEAVYRVLRDDGDTVLVEVVDAPGLEPGFQLRLAVADARAMERVEGSAAPAAAPQARPEPGVVTRPAEG